MTHVITQSCCNDTACTVVCPVDAIHPTPAEMRAGSTEMLYIDPKTCIDCGMCVIECPVGAIFTDDALPAKLADYARSNAEFFESWPSLGTVPPRTLDVPVLTADSAVRVAVVGSGPSGSYAAIELLDRGGASMSVDVYDRLPTPGGLARAGVAPDHLSTKGVADAFAERARDKRIRYFFNIEIGKHISAEELSERYDAVIYAVGASSSRALGIEGEDLPGSHAATEFVGWYNGHPDYAHYEFDLSARRAVVVGNGNVALDVARVLTASAEHLHRSDIAPHALKALTESNIEEVVVLGRRGAIHAACTSPELQALGYMDGLRVHVDHRDLELTAAERASLATSLPALSKHRIFTAFAEREWPEAKRTIAFRFLESPSRILGTDRVEGLEIMRNRLVEDAGRSRVEPTGEIGLIESGLILRSVGYRGIPMAGLPFDETKGTFPNQDGRVLDPSAGAQFPGIYTAGWMKRGPSGVIGTNKECSRETVTALLEDKRSGALAPARGTLADIETLLRRRQPELFGWDGWRRIDEYELLSGRAMDRPRVKVVDRAALIAIALGPEPVEAVQEDLQ
ncbi:4Fe-4S dicluster domain-containing protein [Pseudarthrobacter sp. NIBRBAC000502772]|uniref:FAD-dependent oxidoreductase n=1 Tax=Pseudarthrobacter sp. NIBRBAC000502772 TaxID=2590775 RepID=UPI00113012CE|nr:FAD-dependent oxidoreductase [Pseudarthrobacter sp. NIBRBAC000502772]QDG66699.1 4Fe-4S dicluster domain-containing protein [Pseudarthrobacter sp. NIBRBAC000502772]